MIFFSERKWCTIIIADDREKDHILWRIQIAFTRELCTCFDVQFNQNYFIIFINWYFLQAHFSELLTIVHGFALQFIWFNWFQWVLILLISYLVLISKSLNSDSDKRTQMNAVNVGFFLNHKTNKTAVFTTETL